jgi:L-ribulose-5-phosphate 4-epimerase
MLDDLKKQVCDANLALRAEGLAAGTWGNVSGIDRKSGLVVIKASGIPIEQMQPHQMVVVRLADGEVAEGELKPSTDTPTHLELYRAFSRIGGVAHTHSLHATAWAQAGREIPVLGTTHADGFHGPIPCTRRMTGQEIDGDYEAGTGKLIVERFAHLDPMVVPAVLVASHGPFAWGVSAGQAVEHAAALEHVAMMASATVSIEPYTKPISRELLDKHYYRKHGPGRYYGQE